MADITDGEVLQLRALGNARPRASSDYVEIAAKKTARLFAQLGRMRRVRGRRLAAARSTALRDFGLAYGIAFQMQDDLLDMTSTESALGKPVGNDLHEKKMTIPLILALAGGDREFRADVERFYAEDDTHTGADRRRDRGDRDPRGLPARRRRRSPSTSNGRRRRSRRSETPRPARNSSRSPTRCCSAN